MVMQGGMTASWRRFGLALIVLGLALRMFVAPGTMPVATPEGATLTLCTAQGPVQYKLDIHGSQPAAKAHDPCPYGALGALPLLPELVIAVAPLVFPAALQLVLSPADARPHIGVPAPPPPATGPPTLF